MDAETRHQLKQNELAEAIGDLKQKVAHMDRNTVYLLIGIAAIIILWIAYGLYNRAAAQQQSDVWFQVLTAPVNIRNADTIQGDLENLRQLATQNDGALADAARLRLGVGLWNYAEAPNIEHPEGEAANLLNEAASVLEPVAQTPASSSSPGVVAAAKYALAGVYESLGRWDDARAQYESLQDERFAGTVYGPAGVSLTKNALQNFDELQEPVKFAAPAPAEEENVSGDATDNDASEETQPTAAETSETEDAPATESTPTETDAEQP
jgi:hypothetical protein